MVAEGLAAGLARYPELCPVGTATTASEAERLAAGADVVILDQHVPGAEETALRLRRRGSRVVVLGEGSDEDEGVRVSPTASLATLAAAAVPQLRPRSRGPAKLTARENEILALVGRGLPGKQVARHLGISPKTVEHHKTRIFSKLGVANQAAAVRLAAEQELGRGEPWIRSII
jgi:DNA-binding NarL/FixJ family response regulator